MHTQQSSPFVQRMALRCLLFTCVPVVILCTGAWYAVSSSRDLFNAELQSKGTWIARHLAQTVSPTLFTEEISSIGQRVNEVLLDEDVRYVRIFNRRGTLLFSHADPEFSELFTETVSRSVCKHSEPQVTPYMFDKVPGYHISYRIHAAAADMSETDSPDACVGSVSLGLALKNPGGNVTLLRSRTGLFLGGGLLFVLSGMFVLFRRLIFPVQRLISLLEQPVEASLKEPLQQTADGEIGRLYRVFATIRSFLQKSLSAAETAQHCIGTGTEELLRVSAEQAEMSQRQSTSLFHVSERLDELTTALFQLTNTVTGVSEGTDAGVETIRQIKGILNETVERMREIYEQVARNTERGVQLGEKIARIDNVVKMITTIADQTKLLAFNASIEAAGAGEAGGRFSIVATEVRRLANTVVESVEEIKTTVSSVQTSTGELILSSETGIRKVEQGAELIQNIGHALERLEASLGKTVESARISVDVSETQSAAAKRLAAELKELIDASEQNFAVNTRISLIAEKFHRAADELGAAAQTPHSD